ncbi:hypothetical protein [Planococcus salinus]|uniref:Uncharacterized protein n=1 Tax=Planococcus salinus TaxID=1848460 RepID=A0A3M8P6R1_9BACL|nr:hypothetical protein [Planococcus salinus]RNF39369.1 hypothetical protein EEX84_09800 [Planococcus salinus]
MQPYTFFYVMIALIFTIVIFNKYLPWWGKSLILAYYVGVSYFFITEKNRIDGEYEDVLPVPEEYWEKNTGWVVTISDFLFWPLLGILLFIYIRWFISVQTRTAKTFVLLSLIPAAFLFLFFLFFFNFVYGYRP